MTRYKLLNALDTAYKNDFVLADALPYTERYLDKLLIEGFLENKHRNYRNIYVYWITQKGVDTLRENNFI